MRLRWPGIVRLVLVDPPLCPAGRPYPTPLNEYLELIRRARAGHLSPAEVRVRYPSWTEVESWVEALPTCREEAVTAAYRDFHDGVFLTEWPALSAILLYGSHSDVVTSEDAALLRRTNRRATVRAIDDAGHMIPFERPDLLTKEFC
ncbi:alpha/beta fold hydrolase, partial [Streptosporangium algeriense]